MLTSERLTHIKREILWDSDLILEDQKEDILFSIDKLINAYKRWEILNSYENLRAIVSDLFVKDIPDDMKDEALCVVFSLIEQDCDDVEMDIEYVECVNRKYILNLLKRYDETAYNVELVQYAIGELHYSEKVEKLRKKRKKASYKEKRSFDDKLSDDEVDWEND